MKKRQTYQPNWLQRGLVWLAFKVGLVGPKNWFRTRRITPKNIDDNDEGNVS